MTIEEFSMIQECTLSYTANAHPDGSVTVTIEIPSRFAELWLVKLSALKATAEDLSDEKCNE